MPHCAVTEFTLSELPKYVREFAFLVGEQRVTVSAEHAANNRAAQLLANLHDSLSATNYPRRELERYLVRLLFCLFAEDTFIFEPFSFSELVRKTEPSLLGGRLAELWWTLDTAPADRQRNPVFADFPHVNGGLFADRLPVCHFESDQRDALLRCCDYQWAKISPAIFGSLFQGVMEPKERRQLGAHYTGERDIMKLLNSLFLDDLREELRVIVSDRSSRRAVRLREFQKKLRDLKILAPACGCRNFLILAYRELRALETAALVAQHRNADGHVQTELDIRYLAQVDVDQFYGIEISEWPARIAEVGLWLQDHQSNSELAEKMGRQFNRLPLKTSPTIRVANALTLDWAEVLSPSACSYILGNPPFVGAKFQTAEQRAELAAADSDFDGAGLLDYVTGWYFKAAKYLRKNPAVSVAFVSTNSITQDEQMGVLWSRLKSRHGVNINFAHRTFTWASEAPDKAHVHVVIIGFSLADHDRKKIYDYAADNEHPTVSVVNHISPYLTNSGDIFILNHSTPICDVPEIGIGNKPIDHGNYLFTPAEKREFLKNEPAAKPFFHRWLGSEEFINGIERWCLWLGDCSPAELRSMPECLRRIEAVRKFRLASKSAPTQKLAAAPTRFHVENFPSSAYLLIPEVSSERRPYIPIGFIRPNVFASNLVNFFPNATLYHFGVLSSAMHMAWVKQVCGRLKSDFRYSKKLVYNNYPWPTPSATQREKVETAAQAVLAARKKYPDSTLADLYDPLTMPPPLVRAHTALNTAVDQSYRKEKFENNRQRVKFLFQRHEQLTAPLVSTSKKIMAKNRQARGF
ncbi:MAG: hypothetical protein LBD30_00365 [Verrucomicrobiales bacterium]|nr:hypothetical protein [Verrucomicrobiales bacterium]